MEYGSDGQIKPVTPVVKPTPPAPLTSEQRLTKLEARVTALENQKPVEAPAVVVPAPVIEEAKEV